MSVNWLKGMDHGREQAILMVDVEYRTADVEGLTVFYREAGASDAPTLVLLHGFPSASHISAS
jgi:hypothetical protein